MSARRWELADPAATETWARRLAAVLPPSLVVALEGDLGAGKTTLVRGVLRGLGHAGAVRSPTYTLIEGYACGGRRIHHLDLYRLADPEELEFVGVRDLFDEAAVLFVEWPLRGEGVLPPPDLVLALAPDNGGRMLTATARSEEGARVLGDLWAPEVAAE